jgi:2-dehydro-3-deoxyphosphogluconate aldolase/(4S)-4-hydroxy-2-oxoglutarate aldolase
MKKNLKSLDKKNVSAIDNILSETKIIPIMIEENIDNALSTVDALLNGGITVVEVTLRTPQAFKISEAILKKFPEIKVGVGTILNKAQLVETYAIGANFGISPGLNEDLMDLIVNKYIDLPYMPGVSTPSEIMHCVRNGFLRLKCFPISSLGGIDFLKQMNSVFSDVKFCPTGGINLNNAFEYLSIPNVISVGGSFIIPKDAIENKDWKLITKIAKQFSNT